MYYYCCGFTDKGSVRNHNEDAFLIKTVISDEISVEKKLGGKFIAAVADGVAGENGGEIASFTALKLLAKIRLSKKTDYKQKILDIHKKIIAYGKKTGCENMQTTLCALIVGNKDELMLINVGDSRLYLFREGFIHQLSDDQSVLSFAHGKGRVSIADKSASIYSHMILPVIGNTSSEPEIQIKKLEPMRHGDIMLLCTDGLSDALTNGEIEEILSLPLNFPARLKKLIDTAAKNKSEDNITVVGITKFM